MRVQKYLSQIGYCSRRQTEELIKAGKITVNGQTVKLGDIISNDQDEIKVNDIVLTPLKEKIHRYYIILNKPVDYICSNTNSQGKSVMDLISDKDQKKMGHIHIVGRLDKDSEGLVLLTNDGELTNQITHPRYEHKKEYEIILNQPNKQTSPYPPNKASSTLLPSTIVRRVSATKKYSPSFPHGGGLGRCCPPKHKTPNKLSKREIEKLKNGMHIGRGQKVQGITIKKIKNKKNNIILNVILKEGKNRQIRKMFGKLGYNLTSLKRVKINKLKLGNLKLGQYKFINKKEII